MPHLVEHIFLVLLYDKSFYRNHQIIIWLMTKHIELNVPIFIICLNLANTNIIWWHFHWNLYICNNLFMYTFTYWIALLTKPVLTSIWTSLLVQVSWPTYWMWELSDNNLSPTEHCCGSEYCYDQSSIEFIPKWLEENQKILTCKVAVGLGYTWT